MKERSCSPLGVFTVLLLGVFAMNLNAQENWAERFDTKMTPTLEEALAGLSSGEYLDVYAVMKDRLSREYLESKIKDVPIKDRHKVVAAELKGFADNAQQQVRALLNQRTSASAEKPVKVIWLSNLVCFSGTADEITAVRDLSGVGYLGLLEEYDHETLHDAFFGRSIYYTGFESGAFGPEWTTGTTGSGLIQVTSANDPIGNYHVTMEARTSNSDGTCQMTLTVDLSGVTDCYLDFMFKAFSDESHPEDAVSISDDGVTYYTVLPLSGGSSYEQKYVDIDEAAAGNGISLTSDFRIRFSWKDNYPIPTDGFAFDEIKLELGDPPPTPPTPNVVKLQAPLCWDVGVSGDGALILNIDSGVDYTHPDLLNQIWANPGEVPFGNNGIDDDNNGYIDDFKGWDFESNDNDPYPSSSHGTNTAGIVCGDGTAGTQTGMAPNATMAIAKLGSGQASYWEAQQYAVLIGARVITSSYSYKWGIHDPDYHVFRTNCVNEELAGIIHANSIGNQGDQTSSYPIPFNISAPGCCPAPWVHPQQVSGGTSSTMGCAGVELDESLYTPSGQGPSAWEDVRIYDAGYGYPQDPAYWDYPYGGFGGGQPGLLKPDVCTYTNVKTTTIGGGYSSSFGGTSAATPHLGGAMCLMVSGNLNAAPRKVCQALQTMAEDKGPAGKDQRYGAGKVQVYDALLRVIHNVQFLNHNPSIGETTDLEISGVPGEFFILFYSDTLGSTTIPGLGTLEIGPPAKILLFTVIPPGGMASVPAVIPNNPVFIGLSFYLQSVMDDRNGATGQFLFSLVEDLNIQP